MAMCLLFRKHDEALVGLFHYISGKDEQLDQKER